MIYQTYPWGGGVYSKSEVNTLLTGKADTSHTHTKSQITDFPAIPTKTSDLTNDSGFLTSHQDLSGYIPTSGGAVLNATLLGRVDTDNIIRICGGTDNMAGASIQLNGKDTVGNKGMMFLVGYDGTSRNTLTIKPDGNITANNGGVTKNLAMQEDVIPRSGGSVLTGEVYARNRSTGSLFLCGDTTWDKGACLILRGELFGTDGQGFLYLRARSSDGHLNSIELSPWGSLNPSNDNYSTLGLNSRRWSTVYSATSTINTSDSRLKNTITDIDDSLLDAWESIQPKQYKFNDATESKGDSARFHTGYIAQDIQKACTDNDIDATRYGLFCYDSWEEEPEITEDVEVEKDGVKTTEKRIVQQKREKGDIYALRYEETLVVECAYLRRENNRLKERLSKIEKLLNI